MLQVAEVIARPHDRTVTVGRRELDRDFGQQLRDWVVDQVSKVAMAWRGERRPASLDCY